MNESHLSPTGGTTLRQAVEEVAAEWVRNGWLRKFVKDGQEFGWVLVIANLSPFTSREWLLRDCYGNRGA